MDLEYCSAEGAYAYYVKGHVPIDEFMAQIRLETDESDLILFEDPVHTWKRFARDFQENESLLVDAKPKSQGAFPVTWIESI